MGHTAFHYVWTNKQDVSRVIPHTTMHGKIGDVHGFHGSYRIPLCMETLTWRFTGHAAYHLCMEKQARRCTGHTAYHSVWKNKQGVSRVTTRPVGRVRKYFKNPRIESCRVRSFQNVTGRPGSPQPDPRNRGKP